MVLWLYIGMCRWIYLFLVPLLSVITPLFSSAESDVCIETGVCVYMRVYACICVYVRVCACICVYMRVYAGSYTHIRVYETV